jgi:hypothetical protein
VEERGKSVGHSKSKSNRVRVRDLHLLVLTSFELQLPMVWNACYLLWVLLDERGLANKGVTVSIAAYCAVFSYLCHVAQGSAQFYTFQAR